MLIVNETQVIVDIVPELMLHIMLPSDWGVVAIIIVMAVIATFTLVVCITIVTVSPSPQSKDEENEKLHKLREYARDFRRQHTTDAEQFDWDSDDGDYGLAIGRLVVT
jgi:Na+/melibiose symporter-like transporter